MADKYNKETAQKMLIKHNGDLNKVIEEWFAEDAAGDHDSIPELVEITETESIVKPSQQTNQVRFGPSEREPSQNWSMVTTENVSHIADLTIASYNQLLRCSKQTLTMNERCGPA